VNTQELIRAWMLLDYSPCKYLDRHVIPSNSQPSAIALHHGVRTRHSMDTSMDTSWRDVFTTKSVHDIRQIVYDARQKAASKKSELRSVVRYFCNRGAESRNSHRDLLKTAITVVEMREVLKQVEYEYRGLMSWERETIDEPVSSAERYAKALNQGILVRCGVNFRRERSNCVRDCFCQSMLGYHRT